VITAAPMLGQVAAVSCGLYEGTAVLDLDYAEDSNAEADANFVLTAGGGIVEIQATAEKTAFLPAQFDALMALARKGTDELHAAQLKALAG
jgi:ribonuclease PH